MLLTTSVSEKVDDASVCGANPNKEDLRRIVAAVAMSAGAALGIVVK